MWQSCPPATWSVEHDGNTQFRLAENGRASVISTCVDVLCPGAFILVAHAPGAAWLAKPSAHFPKAARFRVDEPHCAQLPPLPIGRRCHLSTDCVEIWGRGCKVMDHFLVLNFLFPRLPNTSGFLFVFFFFHISLSLAFSFCSWVASSGPLAIWPLCSKRTRSKCDRLLTVVHFRCWKYVSLLYTFELHIFKMKKKKKD